MRILFLHNNFPAQFGFFGQYLMAQGWDVLFGTQRQGVSLPGVRVFNYKPHRTVTETIHPYAASYESAVLTGQAVARQCIKLRDQGLSPDIVVGHSGWGPGMFVRDVWPETKYIGYFEWYYRIDAPDISFLGGEPQDLDAQLRSRARNTPILVDLAACDAGICPTHFQRAQFPKDAQEKLTVLHDGVDTKYYAPASDPHGGTLTKIAPDAEEIITYVARGLEPYRGFPEFMKAMEIVLARRPAAHVVVVGEDRVVYGKKLPDGKSYKKRAQEECNLDWGRVHFSGLLPRDQYRAVLQASTVHAYLTIPFVLSWSMLEAMSTGCCIVASDVSPVREISSRATDALTLTKLAPVEIADTINSLLDAPEKRAQISANARALIQREYAAEKLYPVKEAFLKSCFDNAQSAHGNTDTFQFSNADIRDKFVL